MTELPAQAVPRRLIVAGAAGGVGTTTVTALLALALGRQSRTVALSDHSGGGLTARLAPGWVSAETPEVLVEDRAARPVEAARDLDGTQGLGGVLVLVASATPTALALLPAVLDRVGDALGGTSSRLELVLAQVHGTYRPRTGFLPTTSRRIVLLPHDHALAAGGLVAWPDLTRRTRTAVESFATELSVRPD